MSRPQTNAARPSFTQRPPQQPQRLTQRAPQQQRLAVPLRPLTQVSAASTSTPTRALKSEKLLPRATDSASMLAELCSAREWGLYSWIHDVDIVAANLLGKLEVSAGDIYHQMGVNVLLAERAEIDRRLGSMKHGPTSQQPAATTQTPQQPSAKVNDPKAKGPKAARIEQEVPRKKRK